MKKLRIISLIAIIVLCFAGVVFAQGTAWSEGEFKRVSNNKYVFSTLEITHISNSSFQFALRANSGSHTGYVKGMAYIDNDIATFDDGKGGTLRFTLSNDTIQIEESNKMSYYCGIGVYFGGSYTDVKKIKTPVKSTTYFTDRGIFKGGQEQEFIRLVGDNYQKFTDYAQRFSINEKDLDNSGARVHPMFVRGMLGFMESIIIVRDSDNAIWAAIIDNDKVLYFTNTSDTKFVPITISRWHDRFKNKPIHLVK